MAKQDTNPTPENFSDVDILGMADALNISAEDRGLFSTPNEGKEEEAPEVVEGQNEDAETVVSEEEKSEESEEPKEEKDEESDEKEGEEKEKEEPEEKTDEEEETSGVQKRINKLTARNKEYESQIETLREEVEELKAKASTTPKPAQTVDPSNPLGDVFDLNGLNQARENALEAKEWALSNPDGGSYKDAKGEEILVTKEQVTKLLVNSSRLLDRDIPKRRQYLEEAQGNWVEARRAYPTAFDEKHPDSKQAGAMADAFPQIKQFPDWPLLILDMLAGQKMRTAALKAKPSAEGKKVVPFNNGKAPKVIGSPQSQSGPKTKVAKTVSDYAKGGLDISEADAADLLSSFM